MDLDYLDKKAVGELKFHRGFQLLSRILKNNQENTLNEIKGWDGEVRAELLLIKLQQQMKAYDDLTRFVDEASSEV